MSLVFIDRRSNKYERYCRRIFSFVPPSVTRSVLHHNHNVTFFEMNYLAINADEVFGTHTGASFNSDRCVLTSL